MARIPESPNVSHDPRILIKVLSLAILKIQQYSDSMFISVIHFRGNIAFTTCGGGEYEK